MKYLFWSILSLTTHQLLSQNLQLHYELAHTADAAHNNKNFPALYFEYFKSQNDTSSFIKPGAFLLKAETDLQGSGDNINKAFIQASQTFRFWTPDIFISVQYSGGLSVTEPRQYSYYIYNSFSAGLAYAFQWQGAYFNAAVYYVYNELQKPGNDMMFSFYWGRGFWNYKIEFNGDFELYTLNKNRGDDLTDTLRGKTLCFFGEPQVWFKIHRGFSMGSKFITYYHVITPQNFLEVYPTIAARIKF